MAPFRLVILISGNGSNLQAIIDALALSPDQTKIVKVISNRIDAFGLTRAKQAGIDTECITATSNETRENYDARLIKSIADLNPDLIILAGFMRILSKIFIDTFTGKIINIHPSLLPKYPGLNTHEQVLQNQDKEHGCTIHFVTENLDAGPIIAQKSFLLESNETLETLKQKVHILEHELYPKVIFDLIANRQKALTV